MELKQKTVVITGASRGLGRQLVIRCAKEHAHLIAASRNKSELQTLADETGALPVIADITDEKQVITLAETANKRFGSIDIWINNAGIWVPHGPVLGIETSRLYNLFSVNVFGTIYGSKAALSLMLPHKSGVIVNILSTSALEGRPNSAAYCASKFAADGFTKSLRAETKDSGIKVISVYPGGMKTHLFDEKIPTEFDRFMDPKTIADTIIEHIIKDNPDDSLIIRRQS